MRNKETLHQEVMVILPGSKSALIPAVLPKIHSVFQQEGKLLEVGRTRPDKSHFLWGRNMASLLAEKQLAWKCGRLWTPNPQEEHL